MCTALSLSAPNLPCLFGRTMDLEYHFGQAPQYLPSGYAWRNRVTGETFTACASILGMGVQMDGHPLYADGMNAHGLACAGLNFPGYAVYASTTDKSKVNLSPDDVVLWILSSFTDLTQVRQALSNIHLVAMSSQPTLHWMVTDHSGQSIVVEPIAHGLQVQDNPVGVMTNAPTFDWHLTHLAMFSHLQSTQPQSTTWGDLSLHPHGQGFGLLGLPGDCSPASRFVRAAYLRNHTGELTSHTNLLAHFFHITDNLAMPQGAVVTPDGKADITQYACAMDLHNGVYYYHTHGNRALTAVKMPTSAEMMRFAYRVEQEIYWATP